ncbi:MAG: hypothetical protein JO166_19780 [Deltaproteobacteria bacterium]|nr:hypothetical protein [Deltaproteobacteria bacterium]
MPIAPLFGPGNGVFLGYTAGSKSISRALAATLIAGVIVVLAPATVLTGCGASSKQAQQATLEAEQAELKADQAEAAANKARLAAQQAEIAAERAQRAVEDATKEINRVAEHLDRMNHRPAASE